MGTWAGSETGCLMPASRNRRSGKSRMGFPETLPLAVRRTALRARAWVILKRMDSCPAGKNRTWRKPMMTAWWRRARNEGGGNWSAQLNVRFWPFSFGVFCLVFSWGLLSFDQSCVAPGRKNPGRVTSTRCWVMNCKWMSDQVGRLMLPGLVTLG